MLRIALDLDGVLANSIARWIEIWNEKNHRILQYHMINKWDFWVDLGVTSRQFEDLFKMVWESWWRVEPMEERIAEKVEALNGFGTVDIVTGRLTEEESHIREWLRTHSIRYSKLFLNAKRKSALDYDVYIDDSPETAKDVAATGRPILLRDQPWNRDLPVNTFIKRIGGLEDALKEMERLSFGRIRKK
ncbi:MAG: hypothetical protein NZ920_03085 [Aigarchaeota archaeon]|nr:hypothetical protein [Aigarchaeota archaeon]MDW8092392.1 hypothetical protein [Nitrososphaerota archaeon]